MPVPDPANLLFQLTVDLVNQGNRNIFLTGKAGTGKTTFLKHIKQHCPKQLAVLAPTGVAAINAGGVTIHSFFQLPFSPFIPTHSGTGFKQEESDTINVHTLLSRLRLNDEKRTMLRQLELLIIDEISMVRCDTIDAVDMVLRHVRKRPFEPYGGVQVLFIGDMFQLPPVIKEQEWQLLQDYYDCPYFFGSHVVKAHPLLHIEFEKIYRQREENFIHLLNQLRNNCLDAHGLQLLESRYQPNNSTPKGCIVLTTHNEQARNINRIELEKISGIAMEYTAEISGNFVANSYPADESLQLKKGAQVMFIRNDAAEKGKRYFNGKIGHITRLETEKIFVLSDDVEIEVTKETWENITYSLDKTTQSLKEEVMGSFSQFPLRLAWAITIHKSQGLTFTQAIIDAGSAFAPGQVYVALSRCTSLEGLILKSRILPGRILNDSRIIEFSHNATHSKQLNVELQIARRQFQEKTILDSFNFTSAFDTIEKMMQFFEVNNHSFNEPTGDWLKQIYASISHLHQTAQKFHTWLLASFTNPEPISENIELVKKTGNAVAYFNREIAAILTNINQSPAVNDSRQLAQEYNSTLKEIHNILCLQQHLLQGIDEYFDTEKWLVRKNSFRYPIFNSNAYAAASQEPSQKTKSSHPILYAQLKEMRDELCEQNNIPVYMIAGSRSLLEMTEYLPLTPVHLKKIAGFGHAKVQKWGAHFLTIMNAYCEEHNLSSQIENKKPTKKEKKSTTEKKPVKGVTFQETLRLFKEGKTIDEIAKERNFARSTIEGHMSRLIKDEEIPITALLSAEKMLLIQSAINGAVDISLSQVKAITGDKVSYGEINMVLASLNINQPSEE